MYEEDAALILHLIMAISKHHNVKNIICLFDNDMILQDEVAERVSKRMAATDLYFSMLTHSDFHWQEHSVSIVYSFSDRGNFNSNYFTERFIWLAPEGDVDKFPLRLDSNFYTWSLKKSTIHLKQAYKIRNVTVSSSFGMIDIREWSLSPVSSLSKWERRSDLMGIQLIDISLPWAYYNVPDDGGGFEGSIGSVMKAIAEHANFTINIKVPSDGKFGSATKTMLDNGTISYKSIGIIADLLNGIGDMSSGGQVYSPIRSELLEITHAINKEHMTLMVSAQTTRMCPGRARKAGDSNGFGVYVSTLTVVSWLAFFSLLAAIILALSAYHKNEVASSVESVIVALTQRSRKVDLGPKHLALTLYSLTFFMHAVYTTGFTAAFMTEVVASNPDTLEDLLHGGYTLWLGGSTAVAQHFKASEAGTTEHEMIERGQVVFKTNKHMRQEVAKFPCTTVGFTSTVHEYLDSRVKAVDTFKEQFHPPYGILLPPNSEFKSFFTHMLLKFRQLGVLDRSEKKYKDEIEELQRVKDSTWHPIGAESLNLPLVVCSVGICTSFIMSLCEKLMHELRTRKKLLQ